MCDLEKIKTYCEGCEGESDFFTPSNIEEILDRAEKHANKDGKILDMNIDKVFMSRMHGQFFRQYLNQ